VSGHVGRVSASGLTLRLWLSFRLAYALSWARAFPLAAAHLLVLRGEGWPAHYPALFGPAIAAVAVTAWTMGRPGIGDLLARGGPA